MALRNSGTAPQPRFEEPGPAAATAVADAPAPAAQPAAQPATSTAANLPAVKPAGGALAAPLVPLAKLRTILDELQDQFDKDMLTSVGYGTFPRITIDQSGFSEDKTNFLGTMIQLDLVSWNYVTVIGCNENNNKEADKLVRSAIDHVNLDDGSGTVAAYVEELKAQGYKNANSKKYIQLYGRLLWTEKMGDIAPENQELVQVSLSPTSVSKWDGHRVNSRLNMSKGLEVSSILTIGAERATSGSNIWGKADFTARRPK